MNREDGIIEALLELAELKKRMLYMFEKFEEGLDVYNEHGGHAFWCKMSELTYELQDLISGE